MLDIGINSRYMYVTRIDYTMLRLQKNNVVYILLQKDFWKQMFKLFFQCLTNSHCIILLHNNTIFIIKFHFASRTLEKLYLKLSIPFHLIKLHFHLYCKMFIYCITYCGKLCTFCIRTYYIFKAKLT